MKRLIGFSAIFALPLALAGCPGDDTSSGESTTDNSTGGSGDETAGTGTPVACADPADESARVAVDATIDGDTTWTCGQVYVLNAITFVNSGTLTIEPGTTIWAAPARPW